MGKKFIHYQTPDEAYRLRLLDDIVKRYPFMEINCLSKSLCGREIHTIEIGSKKEQILLLAAFHGMEWLSSLLLLHFTRRLGSAIKLGQRISDVEIELFLMERGVCIVPCVNPDGVEISLHGSYAAGPYWRYVDEISKGDFRTTWQANARGVDINHNFDADWESVHELEQRSGIIGPAPTRYGGTQPESEPETMAVVSLCNRSNFRHALAFHSQGEEIYWNYGSNTPERSELMAKVFAVSSGYKVSEPEGLAVGGGFKDWFIMKKKRPGFTIEVGHGQNPLPLTDLPSIYRGLEEMLVLSLIM